MDDDVQTLISRFREATRSPPDDPTRRAIYRRVQARTSTGATPVVSRTPWVIALACAAALVMMWALADGLEATRLGAATAHEQALDHAESRVHAGASVPALLRTPIASPPTVRAPPSSPTIPAAVPAPRARVSSSAPLPPAPEEAASEDALRREAALLERARRAALADDAEQARAAIDAHAREFPRGVLAPERWVLGIELACAAGAHALAARDAALFFAAYPRAKAAQTLRDRPCDRVTIEPSRGQ